MRARKFEYPAHCLSNGFDALPVISQRLGNLHHGFRPSTLGEIASAQVSVRKLIGMPVECIRRLNNKEHHAIRQNCRFPSAQIFFGDNRG